MSVLVRLIVSKFHKKKNHFQLSYCSLEIVHAVKDCDPCGALLYDLIDLDLLQQELYSHAYNDAAVMFAACPDFMDFYSEEAANNQGLECIR